MLIFVGVFCIFFSIIFGFVGDDGNFSVLIQPFEFLIIVGSACGIFIITNPRPMLKMIWQYCKKIKSKYPYSKEFYLELLTMMSEFLRFVNSSSLLVVEDNIEKPEHSKVFSKYTNIINRKYLMNFLCDNYRVKLFGMKEVHEIENILEEQIYEGRNTRTEMMSALYRICDALPALGIIAAVLGVINAMGSISNPDILGQKIAAALIGTFLGVMLSYCVASPISGLIEKYSNDEIRVMECVKASIVAHAKGFAPSICIEMSRQKIPEIIRPTFVELEEILDNHNRKR